LPGPFFKLPRWCSTTKKVDDDALPILHRNDLLDEVRCFFFDQGHDLSDAACLIAGAPGEARVISLALRLDRAGVFDDRTRRDLAALRALLALDDVREGDPVESFLLSGRGPASRKVEATARVSRAFSFSSSF
jgi:hypothetical protein